MADARAGREGKGAGERTTGVQGSSAYRHAPTPRLDRYAPALDWTATAATFLAIAGLVLPLVVVVDLMRETGCRDAPTPPHVAEGLLLGASAVFVAYLAKASHRRVAGWMRRRVRVPSAPAGFGMAALSLAAPAVIGLANAAMAWWFYFAFCFHICFSVAPVASWSPWSGC